MDNRLGQDRWAGPTQDRVRRQPCYFWAEGSRSPAAAPNRRNLGPSSE